MKKNAKKALPINTNVAGRRRWIMSDCKCQHPDLKPKDGSKCCVEQIKKCHGDEKHHPCDSKKEEEKK
jgi:hypothetical protein